MHKILFGMAGIAAVALVLLQGVAVNKKGQSFARQSFAIYESSPEQSRFLFQSAIQQCLEEKAQGKLPHYYLSFVTDIFLFSFKFFSENKKDSLDDQELGTFLTSLETKFDREEFEVMELVKKEPIKLQNRVIKVNDWIFNDYKALPWCVNPKIVRMSDGA